jgi:hypothetical protein
MPENVAFLPEKTASQAVFAVPTKKLPLVEFFA